MAKVKKEITATEGEIIESEPQKDTSEVAVRPQPMSVMAGLTTDDLKMALEVQTDQRKLIADFVKKHLKPGVDYIRIHVVKNCSAEEQRRGSCHNKAHFSKDILAKPGQEKIFSLFGLTSELARDDETMDMLKDTRNPVAYKCIVKRGDIVVAEGRGAGVVGENRRDVNATIKISEKRARMDACLALGFSEYFVQDLDDTDYQNQKRAAEEQTSNSVTGPSNLPIRNNDLPVNDQERTVLVKWMIKRGFESADDQLTYLKNQGVVDPKKLTAGQAIDIITILSSRTFAESKEVTIQTAEVDTSSIDDKKVARPELESEPELEVDTDLKAEVERLASELCLNSHGDMWLMKKIAGKPFAKWDTLNDDEWRRAYDIVLALLDGSLALDKMHIKDGTADVADAKLKSNNERGELYEQHVNL